MDDVKSELVRRRVGNSFFSIYNVIVNIINGSQDDICAALDGGGGGERF